MATTPRPHELACGEWSLAARPAGERHANKKKAKIEARPVAWSVKLAAQAGTKMTLAIDVKRHSAPMAYLGGGPAVPPESFSNAGGKQQLVGTPAQAIDSSRSYDDSRQCSLAHEETGLGSNNNASFTVTWRRLKFCIEPKWHEKIAQSSPFIALARRVGSSSATPEVQHTATESMGRQQIVAPATPNCLQPLSSCVTRVVLDRLDGSFKSGELTAILGPSGKYAWVGVCLLACTQCVVSSRRLRLVGNALPSSCLAGSKGGGGQCVFSGGGAEGENSALSPQVGRVCAVRGNVKPEASMSQRPSQWPPRRVTMMTAVTELEHECQVVWVHVVVRCCVNSCRHVEKRRLDILALKRTERVSLRRPHCRQRNDHKAARAK